jgi:hypothetical protein
MRVYYHHLLLVRGARFAFYSPSSFKSLCLYVRGAIVMRRFFSFNSFSQLSQQ